MATEHYCFVNPYCSHVLSNPIHHYVIDINVNYVHVCKCTCTCVYMHAMYMYMSIRWPFDLWYQNYSRTGFVATRNYYRHTRHIRIAPQG